MNFAPPVDLEKCSMVKTKKTKEKLPCSVPGCDNDACYKGMCKNHRSMFKKHGCIIRTPRDKNEIIQLEDHCLMALYSKKGDVVCYAKIDSEDLEIVAEKKWYLSSTGYVVYNGRNIRLRLSRYIMNAPDGLEVDHINRDKLDNRKQNLRICTKIENAANRGVQKISSTGYKGVCFFQNKFRAMIRFKNKNYFIGYYDTAAEAAMAYNKKALELKWEFAWLNNI